MKKAGNKKSTAKKAGTSAKTKPASAAAVQSKVEGKIEDGKVDKQPEIKEQAAVAQAMFLYTDDAWAQRYFAQNDLHFLEREVFG